MRRGLLALVIALLVGMLPVRPAHGASIQPGDFMRQGDKGCTLGFVVTSGVDTYFLTAAHCVDVPSLVTLPDGTVLGEAVVEGSSLAVPPEAADDWALVRVRPHLVASVIPTVRGGVVPRGVTASAQVGFGDLIKHSGYGQPWNVANVTREQRFGVLWSQDTRRWLSVGPDTYGDSGGPVVHVATGTALGLVSRLCLGTCTSMGPTIEGIFASAAAAGYPLVLRTG